MLADRYAALERGHAEIAMQLTRINEILGQLNEGLRSPGPFSDEALRRLEAARPKVEVDPCANAEPDANGTQASMSRAMVKWACSLTVFEVQVLNTGKANVYYRRVLPYAVVDHMLYTTPAEYRVSAAAYYNDPSGRACRDITVSVWWNGQWRQTADVPSTFCRESGQWSLVASPTR